MTGFGRGIAEHGRTRATVDVRAVNHRFLDLKLRGAQVAPAVEEAVSSRVRGAIERGAVTVSLHLARVGAIGSTRIDPAAARAAHTALSELARTLGTAAPELALVLAQPGVVATDEPDEALDASVLPALDAALAQLGQMREVEGQALARELVARLDELTRLQTQIHALAASVPELVQKRLQDRLRRLLRDEPADKASDAAGWPITESGGPRPTLGVDPGRLAQEVALLADRADVTEELVRLQSHLDQARSLVQGAAPAGRRLDFLVQEIGRELNTIGSKSAVAEISTAVVEAKAVLEKVREQVQNVE